MTGLAVRLNLSQQRDSLEVVGPVETHRGGPVTAGDALDSVLVALTGNVFGRVAATSVARGGGAKRRRVRKEKRLNGVEVGSEVTCTVNK